jgi:hypothetical protein
MIVMMGSCEGIEQRRDNEQNELRGVRLKKELERNWRRGDHCGFRGEVCAV